MNNDVNFIRNIKPVFEVGAYEKISSREKLVVYAMLYLEKNNIKLLFNYICITAFKLFPERFGFGEFLEYPHIEMLNRTILHLRPKENNYAVGSVRQEYKITKLGYYIADEVDKQLKGELITKNIKPKEIDVVKKNPANDIKRIEQDKIFKKWIDKSMLEESDLWSFFKVTPYSRIDFIKKEIKDIKISSKEKNSIQVNKFILYLENKLNSLL